MMASPMNFSTVPPHDAMAADIAEKYVARRDRRRSGSSCSPSSVDPVTSANRTVTSLRSSAVRSAGLSDDPQEGQNSKPSGFSAPQFAQVTTSEVYGSGFLPVVRTAPFEHAISAGVSPDRHREELRLAGDAAKAHRAERAEGEVGARGEIPDIAMIIERV